MKVTLNSNLQASGKLHGWYRVWAVDRNVQIMHEGWISWIEDLTAYEYWQQVESKLGCTFSELRLLARKVKQHG